MERPEGELVGYLTNVGGDGISLRVYETENGLVFWNAGEDRELTNEELQDPFIQSVHADITESGGWYPNDDN